MADAELSKNICAATLLFPLCVGFGMTFCNYHSIKKKEAFKEFFAISLFELVQSTKFGIYYTDIH